jgi:hypothetical protein
MEARKAYKMIQWYAVYSEEAGSDNEDYFIYNSLLVSFIDCHDMIEEVGMTYHEYYLYLIAQEDKRYEEHYSNEYPDELDIAFEESLLD